MAVAFAVVLLGMLFAPAGVSAHAELVRTDPPINGLVVAPPKELHLTFTEEVATSDPAPLIRVLDDSGKEQPVTVAVQGRDLTVSVPALGPGTWTVSWTVKSASDGHILSGTYAFRVGGGIPAGAATTSGQTPAIWAVICRWLTFFGAAIAAAGYLFGFLTGTNTGRTPVARPRLTAIVLGALVALLATAAEPLLLTIDPAGEQSVGFGEALRSLPTAWWIRPPALALTLVCGLVSLYALRRRLPAWLALAGAACGLGSLLGLSLTSHAAGRDTWRDLAVASDIVHQWSVALWVGGLVHLALWWPRRRSDASAGAVPLPLRRFSTIALGLFAAGVATGVANALFVFPALATLWTSDYGYVLIAKLALLLIPFALAIFHNRAIAAAKKSATAVASVFRTTLRIEVVAAAAVLLAASTLALSAPPVKESSGRLADVTLMAFSRTDQGEITGLVHLRVDPATQGDNEITLWLTDTDGKQIPNDPPARLSLDFVSLNHNTANLGASLTPIDLAASRYGASGLDLSLDGWWHVTAHIARDGQPAAAAPFYLLLPDPNVHGPGAPPTPANDPAAQAILQHGIATMEGMQSLKWEQDINTGADTMVVAKLAQRAATSTAPMMYEQVLAYSASFTPNAQGAPPAPPTYETYHSVTIGNQSWLVQTDGAWLEKPADNYAPISDWGEIYHLAEHLQVGITTEMNGEQVQVITFHTPNEPGQSEAWFAWWVGVDTGRVYQLTMVATMHYMVWDYTDFNGDWTLGPPPDQSGEATPAS